MPGKKGMKRNGPPSWRGKPAVRLGRNPEQIRESLRAYIEERSMPIPFAGCWVWLLSLANNGYGNVSISITGTGRSGHAHRVSYEAFKGPIPDGMLIQHSCDNRWCVNPDHLSVGTIKTNAEDMARKGRSNKGRRLNYKHPTRKLTPEQVREVLESNEGNRSLAKKLGVWPAAIRNVRRGATYRDVTNDNAIKKNEAA